MDNATTHKSQAVKDLSDEIGMRIEWVPPYSPDLNSIEGTFKDLKTWLRRHFAEAAGFESFKNFLAVAVEENCRSDMRGHFRHCCYSDEGVDDA